jgi:hypothetical protein
MDPTAVVGYEVDHLISMELWLKLQGKVRLLQEASQNQLGSPMTYAAAKMLTERVKPGDMVIIGTGFVVAGDNVCETDGPVGAAALARAVRIARGASSILLTEDAGINVVSAACRGMGLTVHSNSEGISGKRHGVVVMGFPLQHDRAKKLASDILAKHRPTAVISVERPGKNIKGVYHSFRGQDISAKSAKFDSLYEMAREQSIVTIGIGDAGNELGMANIRDAVVKNVPYAERCNCPCQAGTACVVSSDVVVMAAVSNWGGSGIAALLSAITGNMDVLQSGFLEKRSIRMCADAGAIDGETGRCEPSVDGSPDELHGHVVELMAKIVKSGLSLRKGEHPIPTL